VTAPAGPAEERSEWLEADGLGGFASGTPSGIRTRRYHALLVAAATPPTGRFVLVNGFDAFVERPAGRFALSSQRYAPDVVHPDGASRLADFSHEPWPRWRFGLPDGSSVEQELFVVKGAPRVVLSWRLSDASGGGVLAVRLFFSGRDLHSLQRENPAFDAAVERRGHRLRLRPYPGVPGVSLAANGRYAHAPLWYRGFAYAEERARGFEYLEDLLSPGELRFDLARGEALCVLEAIDVPGAETFEEAGEPLDGLIEGLRQRERARRAAFPTPPERAADAYVVRRGAGRSLMAGYPWFTDWGRDTFIALRGIALATGRLALARDALLAWSGYLSEGMLPNCFPDRGKTPEYNSVDASLWYCVVAQELIEASDRAGNPLEEPTRASLEAALRAIVEGYARGTRYGIRADSDGLLLAGEPGTTQLTWMDARVGGRPVTPRVGKPVEIQALWVNALRAAGASEPRWLELARRAERSFAGRFFDDERGFLADVVDADGRPGEVDATLRPNQILAVGGLPQPILRGQRARRVVDAVESSLWTPLGLRSLAPHEPGYHPRYEGGPLERDTAYHQGTVWPWLLAPFVDAWVRVRGARPATLRAARARFLAPLEAHLSEAGLGHVSEIADAEPPHTPRGCPFQAWSVGAYLEIERILTAPGGAKSGAADR